MKEDTIGLSELKSIELKCGDCGFALVDIVVIENNEQRQERNKQRILSQYKVVDCPKCGSSSFQTEVLEGTVVIGSSKDGYQVDVEDTEVIMPGPLVITTLRVRR